MLSKSENYYEGDLICYHYYDGNAWYGPAVVLCQKGNESWI